MFFSLPIPRPIIDVASLDGGKSSEKYEVDTFQPKRLARNVNSDKLSIV